MNEIARFVLIATALLTASCSRPFLKEDAEPSVPVTFKNSTFHYVQNFYFKDNDTCKDPELIGPALDPKSVRQHLLPYNKVITLASGAWSGGSGGASWCNPIFISTKLEPKRSYELVFSIDSAAKRCMVTLLPASGDARDTPKVIRRNGTGPWGAGVMAGSFSCDRSAEMESLAR